MDNLLGQISSKLGAKSSLHVITDLKQVRLQTQVPDSEHKQLYCADSPRVLQTSSFSIPSARSRASPSPKQHLSPRDAEEQLVSAEDSLATKTRLQPQDVGAAEPQHIRG